MQEVNRAWSVLGDREARASYDAELGVVQVSDVEDDVLDLRTHTSGSAFRRHLPLWILLGLLAAIFLFTAYAGGPPPS